MPALAPQPALDGIAAYVPLALRRGQSGRIRRGAFLSVDIVGFGAFAERLGRDGVQGAERLSDVLNGFFGRLIDVVHAHGGDVWILAGDAAHVVWFSEDGALDSAARWAGRCALELQRMVADTPVEGAEGFRMRACIGAGALELREVGGVDGRCFPLLSGEAIAQAVRIDRLARPGDVLVSGEAWEVLRQHAQGKEIADGTIRLASVAPIVDGPVGRELPLQRDAVDLERYVLPAVAARLAVGQAAFLAELRTVSIAFVQLAPAGAPLPDEIQATIAAVQEEVQRREGSVYQCLEDDKGLCVVAAFGLPPLSHDDDARRAVEAAVAIRSRLATHGRATGIGVATGQLFCGDCGSAVRRQYSLVGTTINLAARLMQSASGDGLLCDTSTATSARGLDFVDQGALSLKGFAEPVHAHGPRGRTLPAPSSRTVGRRHEIEALRRRIEGLRTRGEGGAVLIRGEAGIGKSALLRWLARMAREQGLATAEGAAEAVERQTPFFAWREVVASWLRRDPPDIAERLRALFGDAPELLDLAPLLATILGVEIPDNDLTRQMSGQVRADNVQRLLMAIAARVAADGPIVVAIEDAHWMDSASWAFAQALRQALPNALFVATLRPVEEALPGFAAFRAGAEVIEMAPLGEEDIAEILRLRLGARQLPEALLSVVATRAAGNPLYAEELALELLDTGVVEIVGDECRVIGGEARLAQVRIPPTIAATIIGRIDRLDPDVLLTLKVASVIGPGFDAADLAAIHPLHPAPEGIARQLAAAGRADMLVPDAKGTPGGHAFRHALIQETTYGLLPFAQRRGLHRAVAEHLEANASSDAAQSFGRLAHHWEAAEVPAKAVEALGRAGRQAMDAHANREAISFLTRALALDGEVRKAPAIDLQRSEWQGFVGQAHYGLMDHEAAVKSLRASIESAGFVFPTGGARASVDLARYLWTRWWPRPPIDDPAWTTRCLTVHRAYSDLGAICLWMGKKGAFAHEAIAAGLAVSRVAPCGQVAYQHAGMALLLGLVGLRKVADRDFRKAVAMAEASQDLLGIASAHVLYGMFLVMAGRPAESLPIYARAVEAAEKLHAGLWRHRALHMSAEGSYFAGQYAASRDLYRQGAQVAEAAERHVTGLAHAMAALATLRLGDADAAAREAGAADGLPVVRENPVPLSLFASLGALMEIHLERDELGAAIAAADEAEAILKPGQRCDDYFAGVHGHAGLAATRLAELARATGTAKAEAVRRSATAVKRLRGFARLYPGAGPRAALLTGQLQQLSGAERRAQRSWRRASVLAERMQQPFESGQAHLALGRSSTGSDRRRLLAKAAEIFGRHGMRGWVSQTEGLLNSS